MNKEPDHLEEIDSLFRKIITIHSSPSQESILIHYIAEWLISQQICQKHEIVSDSKVGILIQKKIIVNKTSELKNGIMFCGHLDSNHLPSKEDLLNVSFERKGTKLYFQNLKENEEMGLDDKTGVVSILKLLEDLKNQKKFKEFELEEVFSTKQQEEEKIINLFVYFSICEEIGQKGILHFPIDQISSKIEYFSLHRIH
jgi:di/tripeptidase